MSRLTQIGDPIDKPDPSTATTQMLLREISSLKELFETRFVAMDKAILLLQAFTDRQPTTASVDQKVTALDRLIEVEMAGRDSATAKIETSFTKQIDAISEINRANSKASDDKIADIKDRITVIESYGKGASGLVGYVFGAAGFIVAIVTIVAFFLK